MWGTSQFEFATVRLCYSLIQLPPFCKCQPTTQSKEEHAKGAFLIKEKSKSDQSVHTQVYSAERCR